MRQTHIVKPTIAEGALLPASAEDKQVPVQALGYVSTSWGGGRHIGGGCDARKGDGLVLVEEATRGNAP